MSGDNEWYLCHDMNKSVWFLAGFITYWMETNTSGLLLGVQMKWTIKLEVFRIISTSVSSPQIHYHFINFIDLDFLYH